MKRVRILIMACLYVAAILAYCQGLSRGMNAVMMMTSYKSSTRAQLVLSGVTAKFAKDSSSQNQDRILKVKRRRRRVLHFDAVAAETVTIPAFVEINLADILRHNFRWVSLEPPTPPPA